MPMLFIDHCERRIAHADVAEAVTVRFPMRRRVFKIVAALSMSFCLATAVLWARSAWAVDSKDFKHIRTWEECWISRTWRIQSEQGQLALSVRVDLCKRKSALETPSESLFVWSPADERNILLPTNAAYPISWNSWKVKSAEGHIKVVADAAIVTLPHWWLCAAFLPLPLLWLTMNWRQSPQRHPASDGLCQGCAYDLRGTPDRCPECGAISTDSGAFAN
jgi:hypothetical protein